MAMDRYTGKALDTEAERIRQSIADILTTRRGTRVMRRSYGSDLPALVDTPISPETEIDLYAATVDAIERWEPAVTVNNVRLRYEEGGATIECDLRRRDTGDALVVGVEASQ